MNRIATAAAVSLLTAACNRGVLDPVGPIGSSRPRLQAAVSKLTAAAVAMRFIGARPPYW